MGNFMGNLMGNFMPCNPRGSHPTVKYKHKVITTDPAPVATINSKSSIDEKTGQPLIDIVHAADMEDLYPKIQNKIRTKTIQATNHTVYTNINIENIRLPTIISAQTLDGLQYTINASYAREAIIDTATEPDSDSGSGYNDPDESPSSRSGKRRVSDLSNLYRDNSDNTWSSEDIEDLHNEMSQQLVDLSKQIINEEMHQVHKQHSLHSPIFVPLIASNVSYNYNNCNDISLPNSNLFCDAMVEKEKEEMEKQIKHLVTLNPQIDHTEM